jgi:alkylation response protein AidB-like acyl-CoA dehydrogenase
MLLTEQQIMIRDMARQFAQEQLAPHSAEWDAKAEFPKAAVDAMGALGLMGMLVPEEWGGAGIDRVSYALAVEELAAGDGSCSTIMTVHNSVGCVPILQYGTQAQKERFLRPLAKGDMLACFCLTEPSTGSDAAAIKTRARRDGNHWVLDGTKQFITNGSTADLAIVFAVSDPAKGKKGITAFLVPTDTPGFKVARLEKKLGLRASDTAQIVLENCRLTPDLMLGQEGEGYRIALGNLEGGRIGIAAQAIGMARAAFEAALAYAKERKTFGTAIVNHQAVQFRLADMATQIEAARLLAYRAGWARDHQERYSLEASMAKLFASEACNRAAKEALQIHGGYGYINEYAVERLYRDAKITEIYEGTSEIQRLVIAKEVLKGQVA